MSKIKTTNTVQLIKKANELVESRYRFDIWETRVMAKMITLISKNDADFKNYRIYLKDIQEEFGLTKNKDAYKRLKEGARRLMDRTVKIVFDTPEGKKELETKVIVGVETLVQKNSFIDVTFHPNMRPFLLQLKSKFLMYDIKNILRIPSVHSIRIYELLKQYEKIGHRMFTIEELKHILSIEDQYKLYGHLKSRIILKAQEDLKKHTDIYFDFKEFKQGRSVHRIKFFIYTNKANTSTQNDKETITEIEPSSLDSPFMIKLIDLIGSWGVPKKKIEKYIKQYDEKYILSRISYVQHQIKVKAKRGDRITNLGGYLHTLMELKDWVNPIQEKKEQVLNKRHVLENHNRQKAHLKEEERQLKTELHNREIEIIQSLFLKDETAKQAAIELAKKAPMVSYDNNKSIDKNLQENFLFRVAVYNKAKELYPELFIDLKQSYQERIKRVRNELNKL